MCECRSICEQKLHSRTEQEQKSLHFFWNCLHCKYVLFQSYADNLFICVHRFGGTFAIIMASNSTPCRVGNSLGTGRLWLPARLVYSRTFFSIKLAYLYYDKRLSAKFLQIAVFYNTDSNTVERLLLPFEGVVDTTILLLKGKIVSCTKLSIDV